MRRRTTDPLFDDYGYDDDQPFDWEVYAAQGEPHTIPVTGFVGYGDDTEEREIEVEVRANCPTRKQVFG